MSGICIKPFFIKTLLELVDNTPLKYGHHF